MEMVSGRHVWKGSCSATESLDYGSLHQKPRDFCHQRLRANCRWRGSTCRPISRHSVMQDGIVAGSPSHGYLLCDFEQSTESVGLKIHLEKTKILSNQSPNRRKKWRSTQFKLRCCLHVRVRSFLDKQLQFSNRKQQRSKIESERLGHHSTDTKQELTLRSFFLPHRFRLFNMVVTPTLSYASGTWTRSKEHERMIRSTQRKIRR